MRLPITVFLTTLSFWYLQLNAALPPLYESLTEYQAIVTSPELVEKLNSAEGIQNIKRTENGFIITTFRYTLQVDRVNEPLDQPGPAKFHFIFHELETIKTPTKS